MLRNRIKKTGKRIVLGALALLLCLTATGCGAKKEVVVYTAVDQVFADQIFAMFEQETGIKVKAVYDTEANKTTGLTNRIAAEAEHPVCDVFWNNEFIQTIDLEQKGMLAAYESPSAADIPAYYKSEDHMWTAFGGRARVFLVNTKLLAPDNYPTSIYDFATGDYEGKQLALAYPMFGTTRTMAAAIYAQLGAEEGRKYFEQVKAKGVQIVDGNSVTKDMAASGQVAVGFTDTDDAKEAIEDGAEVVMIYPDQGVDDMGTMMTPSTLAMIKGAPHEDTAQAFIDFVLSEKVERKLVEIQFFDRSVRDVDKDDGIKGMSIGLEEVYRYLDVASKDMEAIFSTVN